LFLKPMTSVYVRTKRTALRSVSTEQTSENLPTSTASVLKRLRILSSLHWSALNDMPCDLFTRYGGPQDTIKARVTGSVIAFCFSPVSYETRSIEHFCFKAKAVLMTDFNIVQAYPTCQPVLRLISLTTVFFNVGIEVSKWKPGR